MSHQPTPKPRASAPSTPHTSSPAAAPAGDFTSMTVGGTPEVAPAGAPDLDFDAPKPLNFERAVLVYQAGIANVFMVDCFNAGTTGREARRLLQDDFRTCEAFARGLGVAGVKVATMACNAAGDITNARWSENLDEAPFSDKFKPVWYGVAANEMAINLGLGTDSLVIQRSTREDFSALNTLDLDTHLAPLFYAYSGSQAPQRAFVSMDEHGVIRVGFDPQFDPENLNEAPEDVMTNRTQRLWLHPAVNGKALLEFLRSPETVDLFERIHAGHTIEWAPDGVPAGERFHGRLTDDAMLARDVLGVKLGGLPVVNIHSATKFVNDRGFPWPEGEELEVAAARLESEARAKGVLVNEGDLAQALVDQALSYDENGQLKRLDVYQHLCEKGWHIQDYCQVGDLIERAYKCDFSDLSDLSSQERRDILNGGDRAVYEKARELVVGRLRAIEQEHGVSLAWVPTRTQDYLVGDFAGALRAWQRNNQD